MNIRGQKQDEKIKILIKKFLFITLCHNLNANIWKMANQRYQVLSPATFTLFGKEVFTDVVKDFEMRRLSGIIQVWLKFSNMLSHKWKT